MKKLLTITLALILLLGLPLSGCRGLVKGSGEIAVEDYPFTEFSGVVIEGPFEVTINSAESAEDQAGTALLAIM